MTTGASGSGTPDGAGISAALVLALAGKAVRVFGRDGHYLSFPLSPWGLDPEQLHAVVNDPLSDAGVRGEADFADLVNSIPTGVLWRPREGVRLWDVHADVLGAILAEAPQTPQDAARHEEALALLKVADGDRLTDSQVVTEYEQFRDAYIAATQEYNNRANEAELSDDTAVQEQWEADRPSLQDEVDAARKAWENEGHRGDVDAAREVLRELAGRSPRQAWQGYRRLFDPSLPEIFYKTGPEGQRYVPTGFIPTDVVDTVWATMTLSEGEVQTLAEQAPEELRSRLGDGARDTGLESVTVEYSTITPHRGWWTPAPYSSRAWRFADPDRILSDGSDPPSGECTAYVTGVVLVRNISVTRRSAGSAREADERRRPITRVRARRGRAQRPSRRAGGRERRSGGSEAPARARVRDHRDRVVAAVSSAARQVQGRLRARPAVTRPARERSRPRPAPGGRQAPPTPTSRRRTRVPARRGASSTTQTVETIGDGEIFVWALECKPLPRSPHPDLGLSW